MNCHCCAPQRDYGGSPYVANMGQIVIQNTNFRTAVWTGDYFQMTLMHIPPCGEIGLEMHPDTDQLIRIEQGNAIVKMGKEKNQLDFQQCINKGDALFVPAGTWHNIINVGNSPLKLSSIYAPPHHPKGTIHRTKSDDLQ